MPYLPVELDAVNIAPDLARASGLTDDAALAGLVRMWAWVFRSKSAQLSAAQLAGFFGGDPGRTAPALVAFGFLEAQGSGWVLTEWMADRLLSTHRQRVQAGKARAASAVRSAGGRLQRRTSGPPAADQRTTSGGPALTPSTQHPAPSTKEKKKPAGSAPADPRTPVTVDLAPEGKPHPAVTTPPESDVDPAYRALVQALFDAFQEIRGVAYTPSGKDWKALAGLRKKNTAEEIERRWRIGLLARYAARCSTFWDLGQRWNACATPEAQGGAQGLRTANEVLGFLERGERRETAEEIEAANRRSEEVINGG